MKLLLTINGKTVEADEAMAVPPSGLVKSDGEDLQRVMAHVGSIIDRTDATRAVLVLDDMRLAGRVIVTKNRGVVQFSGYCSV